MPFDSEDPDNPETLSAAAAEIYRARRARDHLLPKGLTGEPAWDMLLALYSEEPERLTVSSVCHAAAVPQTTAVRWINILEKQGMVQRTEHRRDQNLVLLSLTNEGRRTMCNVLKAILSALGT